MALFHFSVTQIKRSKGQSAVAAAAYRAGEKLYSDYYAEFADYTRKGGVICSEILLPGHAPPEYANRQTLWNAVEQAERGKKAQLAYSFDIALQNEFSLEENIALARQFLLEQFVSRGMVVDFAVHRPDKKDGILNPHFHVLCPIRPLDANGEWGAKQQREYLLDKSGSRIVDEAGNYLFNAVPTTDWGKPEILEAWRAAWAGLCNQKFAEKGLNCGIDHRSYQRQGLDILPTVHESPAVREMESKGITTDKGELNRWIKSANAAIQNLKRKVTLLRGWLKSVKGELSQPQVPNLADLLSSYYNVRNARAWSQKAKAGNLKQFAETVNYLLEHDLHTVQDLEAHISAQSSQVNELNASMKAKSSRREHLEGLLKLAEDYRRLKPVYDELQGIKWKSKREKFKQEHGSDLRLFYMSRRKLEKHFSTDGKLPITAWKKELAVTRQEYQTVYSQYKPLWAELQKLWKVRSCVNTVLHRKEQHLKSKNLEESR